MITDSRQSRERSIFLEALEQGTPEIREKFLLAACAGNEGLRQRVEALLSSHEQASGLFGKLAPERIASALAELNTIGPANEGQAGAEQVGRHLSFLSASDKLGSLGRLGSYEVEEVIGSGGMGIVLKAFDEKLHRSVAIKVMAPTLATNENARRRFIREGRAAAAIRDDHVIGIHGVDETHGLPFLVMEYIVGRSLAERLEADGPLPLTDILRIGGQIARGLAAAHAQGVVHRDIKPANILLENGIERVKITDFGLAHAVDDVRTTQPGTVVGTPEYMSPEQARGERVDHRSDLFSLGCVLYAMCAGRPPFRAESTVAIIRRVCEDTPRALCEINAEIPEWLINLIDKLIAKNVVERFQSAAEVAALLEQCLKHINDPVGNALCGVPFERTMIERSARNARDGVPYSAHRWLPAPGHRLPALGPWPLALCFLLAASLALAETTGVTSVAATVIRIVRGDGTLVVEVDDPNIQVLVDGEEVVINGAGPKEIRLRPGQHELQSVKDGKAVDTKLVTITREGREVVKVAHEAPVAAAPVKASPTTHLVWGDDADTSGSISADGRLIVFTDWDTGDVAVRELATGATRRVTNIGAPRAAAGSSDQPVLSGDGTQLAFTWNYHKDGDPPNSFMLNDLRVVSVHGGEPRVVFKDDRKYPEACAFSPDGKSILATLNSERTEFAQIDLANGAIRIIQSRDDWRKEKIGRTVLSPDGRTIAYIRLPEPSAPYRDIFLIDVQSGNETRVTSHPVDKRLLGWTPDGGLLYDVERQGSRDAWMLRIVDGQPNGPARFVKKDVGTISPLGISRAGTLYYGSSSRLIGLYSGQLDMESGKITVAPVPAEQFNIVDQLLLNDWSPDGESLAYTARLPDRKVEMRILSLNSGQLRSFELESNGWVNRNRWSPDGKAFAGISPWAEGGPGIALIDAQTGQTKLVVEGGTRAVWAPDGRGIFYSKGRRPMDGEPRIVYRDLETQVERTVATEGVRGNVHEPSPDGRQLAIVSKRGILTIRLVPINGSSPRDIYRGNAPEPETTPYDRVLAWTKDGRQLIFYRGGDENQRGLWSISVNGGELRKMELSGVSTKRISAIAIHPDGKQLALSVTGGGKTDLWALENFLPPVDGPKQLPAAEESAAKTK